jgi:hypothetical protein
MRLATHIRDARTETVSEVSRWPAFLPAVTGLWLAVVSLLPTVIGFVLAVMTPVLLLVMLILPVVSFTTHGY